MCEIGALMFRLYRGKEHFSVAFGGETLISELHSKIEGTCPRGIIKVYEYIIRMISTDNHGRISDKRQVLHNNHHNCIPQTFVLL